MKQSHLLGITVAVAVLALASACDPLDQPVPTPAPATVSASPSPAAPTSPSPVVTALPITLLRTGGIAGVHDWAYIDPTGAWQSSDKAGEKKTGQLTEEQFAQLQALAHDPHVAVEAATPTKAPSCMDGFNYLVTVDVSEIRFQDCDHSSEPRVAKAILGVVQGAIPGW